MLSYIHDQCLAIYSDLPYSCHMVPLLLSDLRHKLKQYWRSGQDDFLKKLLHSDPKITQEIFRGVTVPDCRKVAKLFINLDFNDLQTLLESLVHEERLVAIFILELKYKRADSRTKDEIIKFYLKHTKFINNWDLVDASADKILGEYLLTNSREILYKLAKSDLWWERRIAMIATFQFIKVNQEYQDVFKISEILIDDQHDLIQKAVGWMLKEVGKRISREKEMEFLNLHYKKLSRTTLRYSIELFPEELRQKYLKGQM